MNRNQPSSAAPSRAEASPNAAPSSGNPAKTESGARPTYAMAAQGEPSAMADGWNFRLLV